MRSKFQKLKQPKRLRRKCQKLKQQEYGEASSGKSRGKIKVQVGSEANGRFIAKGRFMERWHSRFT